jgi:hypothetical protein
MSFEQQVFGMERPHQLTEQECIKITRMVIRANHYYFAQKMAEENGYANEYDYLGALLGEALTKAMQEANFTTQDAIDVCFGRRMSGDLDDDIPF